MRKVTQAVLPIGITCEAFAYTMFVEVEAWSQSIEGIRRCLFAARHLCWDLSTLRYGYGYCVAVLRERPGLRPSVGLAGAGCGTRPLPKLLGALVLL